MSVKVKDVLDALQQMQKSLECSICLELLKDPHSTKCNHQFCGQCIRQVLEKSSKKSKNKWYCPLCKTPVSKRSLTPNPKLNEIVAAVRNLQGAVQDDTGIPTGSPPSQPVKGPNTDVNSSVVSFPVPQPTPRKNATGRKGRRKASRDQFTVYIEKKENFGHALESQPPQIVSNVNIRSSLRPLPVTQTQTKAKKSAKAEKTRKTRNSRRIQEQKSLQEDPDVGRNSNDDLLHLIDTMTFKPVPTEGSSKDFILDPKTEEKLTPTDNSSPLTITLSTLKEDAGEKDDCKLNPSMQKEKPVCLTTIAEADSSISINPCSSTGLFGNKNLVNCENTAISKEDIVAVTNSKIADSTLLCIPQSTSLDTMQSVSILQSLEVQPHDSAGGFCNESDVEDNQQNDVTTYQGDETDELVANEKCDVENREEMYDETRGNACGENPVHDDDEANFKRRNKENKQILGSIAYTETDETVCDVLPNSIPAKIPEIENHCIEGNNLTSTVICDSAIQKKPDRNYEERETHDKGLPEPSDTILPHENVKTSTEQSLDFEGLVSLFDEPSYSSTSQDAMHKEETEQNSTRLDKAAEQLQQAHTLDKETNMGQSLEAVQQVETVDNISSSSAPKGEKTSPRKKGRGLANLQDGEDSDDSSDLCERVKQRQRRGTSKMLLTESPTTSLTTESKSKKRTVDSMTSFKTRDESSLEGSAKKKFKTSEVPSPSQLSSEKPNTARKQTQRNSEVSSKQKQTEDLVTTDCDERSQSHQSEMVNYSCSTDKSIDSNEMIPASVSSSENPKSAVIDPMDVYADQTHEEKKEVASKGKESLKLHKIKERGIFVEDYSSDLKTAEGRSQDERQHSSAPQVKNAVDHDESTQGFTPSPKLSFLSQKLKDSTSGQSLINELKTSHLPESLPFDPTRKASFNATGQRSQLHEEDFVDQERLITGQDHTAYDEDTHVQRKTLRTPPCSSGINSLKGKETGDTKNNTMERGEYSCQLAENRSKTCKPLSQEGCTSSGTPTQCSLEAADFTPCLFGNNSCETPAKIVSQKRTKRVETPFQEGIEEHNGEMNEAEIEEIGVLDDSETPGVIGLLSGSQKAASLQTGSDGTQSFGTSQSISVLHDLDVPSQGQKEGTDRRDDPSEPAFHAEHSNTETEMDKSWAEPHPKKPRSKQHAESQGVEMNMSNCHGKKKTNGSELTESEIIPPTPPVKTVTKHVFDVHAQSPLKLTSPKRNVQMNDSSTATCHSKSLTVKRKRSIRSPRCSNSPKLQENNDDGTPMHVSSSFSRRSEVNVSVLENHDRSSMNVDIKGLSQAMEFEVGTSASSEQQRVNLSQETSTETLVHGTKINANKTPKRLRRLDNIQRQGTYSESISPRVLDGPRLSQSEANSKVSKYDNVGREDLRDSPSAEVESIHSSPCSPVKRRLDNMGDSFDWSGTRTVQKRGGYSQDSPVALNNCDNNAEHFRGKEFEDCYVDQLNSPNASQARDETEDSSEDFLRKSKTKGELANPFVGNIRVRNSRSVVDEEISLTDAEEEDSSGDESLLKPAFLPKESRKSPESQIDNTHDSDDEEEEVTVFSQELIPSENEDDDDDGASYKALDSTGASTSTFLSEAAASTQQSDPNSDIFSSSSQGSLVEEETSREWQPTPQVEHQLQHLNSYLLKSTDGRISPVRSQCRSDVVTKIVDSVLDAIAPGNSSWLLQQVIARNQSGRTVSGAAEEDNLVSRLVTLYNEARSWTTQQQILSLFAGDYSKTELLQLVPGLTKFRIDEARKHAFQTKPGEPIEPPTITRTRLDPTKVDHFLDFVSSPSFLQDVAYGTKTLKLSSGEKIDIPNVVRTVISSRLIQLYQAYCTESGFTPLGRSTLFNMLKVCAASQKKSLAGLDSMQTDGVTAISSLEVVTSILQKNGFQDEEAKGVLSRLKAGKRYVSTDYKLHIATETPCADHCSTHALSSNEAEYRGTCSHQHNINCDRCSDLRNAVLDIQVAVSELQLSNDEKREELQHDLEAAIPKLEMWKSHVIRSVHQDAAKTAVVDALTETEALLIMDWAMKFLPTSYRETQRDWFGKKGLPWHITVAITKDENEEIERMDVLRQDVEAMEKEMEELRAYLAKTDENREDEEHTLKGDDINYQEADLVDDGDIQPSLTPPPPLTPKSIPPMPQLSTPLKNVSRYLEQEGQSSDEGSECEDVTSSEPVKRTELPRRFGYQGNKSTTEGFSPGEKSGKKRPLSPSDDDDDGLSITEVEHRQEETPSPPRSNHSIERSQEKDEDKLIVIDDRDGPQSRTGSLLLVKRRKLTHDLVPKKSPVVSLLFTRAGKGLEKPGQSPGTRSKGSSPTRKKSSSSIYSRKPGTSISPIRGQSPTKTGSLKGVSHDNLSKKDSSHNGVSRDDASNTSVSQSNVAQEKLSHERSHSPDLLTNVKKVISKKSLDNKREDRTTDRQLSFVATRLNRQQLAEARTLAEMYGGKLASEFNSKTSHVIMTTDENMQVTRHSYTMKYLLGLALGKWIVSHRWIAACNQAKSLVPEVDYEVKGDAGLGQTSIPRVARKARSNKEALLFQDYEVLCLGEFSAAVTKEQLSQLLRFCGASVFTDAESMKRTEKGRQRVVTIDKETRDNAKELKAICRQLNKKPVSLEWVTDSIANYKVQDLKDYIVEL